MNKKILIAIAVVFLSLAIYYTMDVMFHESLDRDFLPKGFIAFSPPINAHGPGWVYEYVKSEGGKTQRTVCSNLYELSDIVENNDISLPEGTIKKELGVNVAFKALKGIIKSIIPSINEDISLERTATLSWTGLTVWEIPAENLYDEKGKVIPVTNQCAIALRDRADSQGRLDSLFVVFEAIKAESMNFFIKWSVNHDNSEANKTQNSGLNLKVDKLFEFETDIKPEIVNNQTLKFNVPRYIGYKAMTLDQFLPSGAFSGNRARVRGRKLTKEELISLSDQLAVEK